MSKKDEQKLKGMTVAATPIKQNITREKLRGLLPKGSSAQVTDEILETINRMGEDTDLPQDLLEEEVMSYMHLVGSIKGIGIQDVINATKYCNLKRNYNNKQAYSIVFPDKYDERVNAGKPIDNYVAMYNATKLVTAIDKENLVAAHIKYYPYFDTAIKELVKVGVHNDAGNNADGEKMTVTPMVKVQALKELIAVTKQPETAELNLNINPGEQAMAEQEKLNENIEKLIASHEAAFRSGTDVSQLQKLNLNIIDAEVEE